MKTAIFILLLFVSAKCFSQSNDSIPQRLKALEHKIQNLESHFEDFNTQYKVGLCLVGGGIVLSAISINANGNTKNTFLFMGGGMGGIGVGLIVSSHFVLAKCKDLTISTDGITYRF